VNTGGAVYRCSRGGVCGQALFRDRSRFLVSLCDCALQTLSLSLHFFVIMLLYNVIVQFAVEYFICVVGGRMRRVPMQRQALVDNPQPPLACGTVASFRMSLSILHNVDDRSEAGGWVQGGEPGGVAK